LNDGRRGRVKRIDVNVISVVGGSKKEKRGDIITV
jgi:hypothetical protein